MMRRIQEKFSWSAADQFEYIPSEGHDLRYGLVFQKVLSELTEDLPEVPQSAKRVRVRTNRTVEEVPKLTPGKGKPLGKDK
jgi:hypothetical protein